ncbi:MAG: hypothetical protein AAGB93_06280 [Planctomycetota bacterium]
MKLSRCLAVASALLVGPLALAQDVTVVFSGVVTNVPSAPFTPPALAPLQPGDLLELHCCLETPGAPLMMGGFLHRFRAARSFIRTPFGDAAGDPAAGTPDTFIRKDPNQDLLSVQGDFEGNVTAFAIFVDDNQALLRTDVLEDLIGDVIPASSIGGSTTFSFSDGNGMLGVSLDSVAFVTCGLEGTNYCVGNPNSTGAVGALTASGSNEIADNDVTLLASELPTAAFGYFIVSRIEGFVTNPGGSAGNLCLGGAIGRYIGPGQIQQTDATGSFSLPIDLTMVPQSTGFVAVQPNETWRFQAWHRDGSPAGPTSNFTVGLEILFL